MSTSLEVQHWLFETPQQRLQKVNDTSPGPLNELEIRILLVELEPTIEQSKFLVLRTATANFPFKRIKANLGSRDYTRTLISTHVLRELKLPLDQGKLKNAQFMDYLSQEPIQYYKTSDRTSLGIYVIVSIGEHDLSRAWIYRSRWYPDLVGKLENGDHVHNFYHGEVSALRSCLETGLEPSCLQEPIFAQVKRRLLAQRISNVRLLHTTEEHRELYHRIIRGVVEIERLRMKKSANTPVLISSEIAPEKQVKCKHLTFLVGQDLHGLVTTGVFYTTGGGAYAPEAIFADNTCLFIDCGRHVNPGNLLDGDGRAKVEWIEYKDITDAILK